MSVKRVVMGSDFSGFRLKEAVRLGLIELGWEVEDVGQIKEDEQVLYFDAAAAVARKVQDGSFAKGIVICGTGAGVSMVAGKFKGVYCVACESVYTAEKTSLINNANMLAMGEKVVSFAMGVEMAEKWLAGNWCEGFEPQRKANNEKGFAFLQQIEKEQAAL